MAKRPGPDGGVYGTNNFAPQEHTMLTDKLAIALGEKLADVQDQLVNNDYEKKFFEWGDTVKVVAIDPNSIVIEARDFKNSLRPMLNGLSYRESTMTINKSLAGGFKIDDLTKIEQLWNEETAKTAIEARKMRETHNLKTLDLILANPDIPSLGKSAPINIFTKTVGVNTVELDPAKELFRIVNSLQMQLERSGATDRDGAYSFGSNQTAELRTNAGLFIAPELKLELLNSQYTRVDDVTEGVIRDGKYEKFAGFILNQANELSTTSNKCCSELIKLRDYYRTHTSEGVAVQAGNASAIIGENDEICAIVAGTKNLVTRASRVLPVEKMRSREEFATEYSFMEIYGEMVAVPQAGVVVICVLPQSKIMDFGGYYINNVTNPASTTLMPQFAEGRPYIDVPAANDDTVTMPQRYSSIGREIGDDDSRAFVNNTGYTQYPQMSANAVTETELTTALNGYVPTTRKVNNHALSSDVTLEASDIEYAEDHDLSEFGTHIHGIETPGTSDTTEGPSQPESQGEG